MARWLFTVRVRLLPTERGGRLQPIASDFRATWNLGNTSQGEPTLNDGRLLLEGCSQPGGEGLARLEPLTSEHWNAARVGSVVVMQQGRQVVGDATILRIDSRPERPA